MSESRACEKCLFWSPPACRDQRVLGQCRRHPPVLSPDGAGVEGIWPETARTDWCGEFKSKAGDPRI